MVGVLTGTQMAVSCMPRQSKLMGPYPRQAALAREMSKGEGVRDVARVTGLSIGTISLILNGDRVSDESLYKFASAYKTPARPLLEAGGHGSPHNGIRDEAIILCLYDTGIRSAEICNLKAEDVNLGQGTLLVRSGKGGKARRLQLSPATRQAIAAYLREAGHGDGGALFLSDGGPYAGEPLTGSGLLQLIRRVAGAAKVQGVRATPHTFRHTFAVDFLRNGGKSFALMEMLGHTSLTITKRYVAFADADIAEQHRQNSPVERLLGRRQRSSNRGRDS